MTTAFRLGYMYKIAAPTQAPTGFQRQRGPATDIANTRLGDAYQPKTPPAPSLPANPPPPVPPSDKVENTKADAAKAEAFANLTRAQTESREQSGQGVVPQPLWNRRAVPAIPAPVAAPAAPAQPGFIESLRRAVLGGGGGGAPATASDFTDR